MVAHADDRLRVPTAASRYRDNLALTVLEESAVGPLAEARPQAAPAPAGPNGAGGRGEVGGADATVGSAPWGGRAARAGGEGPRRPARGWSPAPMSSAGG